MCWKIYLNGLLPAILLGIMVLNVSVESGNRSSTNIVFLEVLAQGLVVLPIIVVPVVYLVRDKEKGAVRDRLRRLLTPTKAWGPYNKTDRLKWASRKAFSTRHSILPVHAKEIKVTEKSVNPKIDNPTEKLIRLFHAKDAHLSLDPKLEESAV